MKPILVFQTDFTYKEGAVSSMYGVVKSVDRELEIIDGTHELPQYDTWSASYRLYQSLPFWPEGTVYVSVVDPGVGTGRRACICKTKSGHYIITPDNGALTHIARFIGIEQIREIDEEKNRLKGKGTEAVAIFHGRDLFAYTAARFASGLISFAEIGPEYPVSDIVTHPILEAEVKPGRLTGYFEINDPNFGNLWTNIKLQDAFAAGFAYGDYLQVEIRHGDDPVFNQKVLFHKSFGFASKGEPIVYNNEMKKLAMAVSQGSFCEKYSLSYGPEWQVIFTKPGIQRA